ncbi:hypothetical protein [Arthrobacter sp. UYCo732]|uniref:hypothetical protein n=1 Tax=Arthrobacter sp. UYCo732 TaxID=3156336 RepID=UPI003392FEA4
MDAANAKWEQLLAVVEVGGGTAFTVNVATSTSPANVYKGQLERVAPNQQGTLEAEGSESPPEEHSGGWLWVNDDEDYHWAEILRLTKEGLLPPFFFEHLSDASIANDVSTDITNITELRAIANRKQLERDAVEAHGVSPAIVDGFL